jgi:hypothetical protein
VTTRAERGIDRTRRVVGRVAAPLLARHHGHPYLARRVVTTLAGRAADAGSAPAAMRIVTVDEAAARDGVTVHRPEPGYPVLDLAHGVVLGPWGHTGTAPHHIVTDLSYDDGHPGHRRVLRECATAASGPVVELGGTTANVAQNHWGNYCHWMTRGVARFELADDTIGLAACDRLLVPPAPPAFVLDIAASFGIGPERLLEMTEAPATYRCERLVAPGEPRAPERTPRWALDRLRARFGKPPTPGAPARVYLGRGASRRRRVVNEGEVLALLEPRGFVPMVMDDRTVAEQAALLASAECVVAPHGAALTNLVFAPHGAFVVELTYRNWPLTMYRDLAATLDLPYAAVPGREPVLPRWLGDPRLIDADTIADVAVLRQVLDTHGIT